MSGRTEPSYPQSAYDVSVLLLHLVYIGGLSDEKKPPVFRLRRRCSCRYSSIFCSLKEDLEFLTRHGKKLYIQLQDVSFDTMCVKVPGYLRTSPEYNGGVAL